MFSVHGGTVKEPVYIAKLVALFPLLNRSLKSISPLSNMDFRRGLSVVPSLKTIETDAKFVYSLMG